MKRFFLGLALTTAFFVVMMSSSVIVTGCKSPTVQSQAVKTLFSVGTAVDTTYKAYLDLVISGQLATNSVPKVAQAYGTFQNAFRVGVELVASNTNAAAPQITLDAAAAFNTAVSNAKKGIP